MLAYFCESGVCTAVEDFLHLGEPSYSYGTSIVGCFLNFLNLMVEFRNSVIIK